MILQRWIYSIKHLLKPIECSTHRINPNVNHGLWGIMICQHRLIDFNKCTILVEDINNVRGWVTWVGWVAWVVG